MPFVHLHLILYHIASHFFSYRMESKFCFLSDMTKILELDQSNEEARRTIIHLKPLAEAKREKMKEEMIGELKQLIFDRLVLPAVSGFLRLVVCLINMTV